MCNFFKVNIVLCQTVLFVVLRLEIDTVMLTVNETWAYPVESSSPRSAAGNLSELLKGTASLAVTEAVSGRDAFLSEDGFSRSSLQ